MPSTRSGGFSLVEVLVAAGIFITVAAGAAQLVAIAVRHGIASRQQLAMSIAAAQKIDEVAAAAASGASGGAVDRAVDGFADATTEAGVALRRRWLIAPLAGDGATAVVIVVRVIPVAAGADLELATIAAGRAR